MKENVLIEIGGIKVVETVYSDESTLPKELEFWWINESNYCMFPDEERETSISREQAIELVKALKCHFSFNKVEIE